MLHVVLVEPEIPQNTGNVARTCAAVGARLHLVKPMGFILSDRRLRRAGLDYWDDVDLVVHENWPAFVETADVSRLYLFTRRAERRIDAAEFGNDPCLVFGGESAGLGDSRLRPFPERCFRIPMKPGARSLNVSNAVAVVLYEAARRMGFAGLE